jgi:hypothetical protein
MFNFQVSRRFDNLVCVSADRAELPFLETIHVRESPAGRAPDNEVHDKEVMRVILIKIYRLIVIITVLENSFCDPLKYNYWRDEEGDCLPNRSCSW